MTLGRKPFVDILFYFLRIHGYDFGRKSFKCTLFLLFDRISEFMGIRFRLSRSYCYAIQNFFRIYGGGVLFYSKWHILHHENVSNLPLVSKQCTNFLTNPSTENTNARIRELIMSMKSGFFTFSCNISSLLDMALELKEAIVDLQEQIEATKEQLMADSEELKIMIR